MVKLGVFENQEPSAAPTSAKTKSTPPHTPRNWEAQGNKAHL